LERYDHENRNRLALGKTKHLSFASRVTLIKRVIFTVPFTYHCLKCLIVGKTNRKIQMDFLWG